MTGVARTRIKFFHSDDKALVQGNTFILMTRYEILAEMRKFMKRKESNLFPKITVQLLKQLENQYLATQSKVKNKWRLNREQLEKETQSKAKNKSRNEWKRDGETEPQCVTRLLKQNLRKCGRPMYRTILIDEAHCLKNVVSYWGLGAALLGLASQRSVPLSGTPYNNGECISLMDGLNIRKSHNMFSPCNLCLQSRFQTGPQDMATLMTFIDPTHQAANVKWWEAATKNGVRSEVTKKVGEWRDNYMIRRDKQVLTIELPPKTVAERPVGFFESELSVYRSYEAKFMTVLRGEQSSFLFNVR